MVRPPILNNGTKAPSVGMTVHFSKVVSNVLMKIKILMF